MQLDKKDLGQIRAIVEEIVQTSEARITSVISREVSDLAEINRVVIEKVDTINILEKRLTRVEHKVGIIN